MKLEGIKVGLAITGSFCTFDKIEKEIKVLVDKGADIYPIFSTKVQTTDSRFGDTGEYMRFI